MFEDFFNIKINVRSYIGSSLRMIKIKHDYWLDNPDKLEDLFTTIKDRFLDISHT